MRTCFQHNAAQIYFYSNVLALISTLGTLGFSFYREFDPSPEKYSLRRSYIWLFYATHWNLISILLQQSRELHSNIRARGPTVTSGEGQAAVIKKNKSESETWRTMNTTHACMITALFWVFAYKKSLNGPALPNFIVHGLPFLTAASFVVANNLTYAQEKIKSYARAAIPAVGYLIFYIIYQKAGGANEEGKPIYAALDWDAHPLKAAIMSLLGLIAIFPTQLLLNRSLNFLRSFPYPVVLTQAQGSMLGTPNKSGLPYEVSCWESLKARFKNRDEFNKVSEHEFKCCC